MTKMMETRIQTVIDYHLHATDRWQKDFSRRVYLKLLQQERMEES